MKRIMVGAAALVVLAGAGCRTGQHTVKVQPPQASTAATTAATAVVPPPSPAFRITKAATPVPTAAVHNPQAELQMQAEKVYQQGLALYHAGQLDEARAAFDHALRLLLTSPYDVHRSPILQAELDHLLDQTHALEMESLREGDGLTEQTPEPAPIDSVAQMTFPVDAATRAEIENQIRDTSSDLPLVLNDPVIQYIHYFTTTGKGFLLETFKRAGRYRPMIERIFREEGVPQDLIYVAQAESGFEPRALSHAGARGMWQFMPVGAHDYGLQRNEWVDEREDPEKSTRAAARDLKDLYREFGDWYLALAAYNSGDGTIGRAVARTGYADFWELYRLGVLPRETRNYIPIIVATALIAKNPQQYGLNKIVEDKPETYDTVKLHGSVDLSLAAECAGTSVSALRRLNPSLLRLATPPGDFALHLPTGTASRFTAALALVPAGKRDQWHFHRAAAGESLAAIARHFHTTAAQIADANHLQEDAGLHDGQPLVIPVSARHTRAEAHLVRYRIRRGDTLGRIAHRFHVSTAQLRAWNHLHSSRLTVGHELFVRAPHAAASHRTSRHGGSRARVIRYHIRRGDTLAGVAHRFGVAESSLRRWNHLRGTRLTAGHLLLVHVQ